MGIKHTFEQMGGDIRNDFYRLKHEFTARSLLTIIFGLALLVGNAYLFVASTIKMFAAEGGVDWLCFVGGLIGFLVSFLLIFIITVHFSTTPQEDVSGAEGGVLFSEKTSFRGRIAIIFLLIFITLGGGGTALGFYFADETKYSAYPQTTATVVSIVNNGYENKYTAVYEYTVDGKIYRNNGALKSSGEVVPRVGDTVSIKYDPLDPNVIRISTESKFLLGLGCFLIFFGLTVIAIALHNVKKLKTQFLLAFILLGLTACIFIICLSSVEFHGLIAFFARNYLLHLLLIFTNVGILELINGIVYIGYEKER